MAYIAILTLRQIACDKASTERSATMTAPITQDVLTIPRKLPEGVRINLVGLTRPQLRDALIAAGTPEKQAKMRVGQIWQWVYYWGIRDFARMTNLAKDYRALLAERFEIVVPEAVSYTHLTLPTSDLV